jgi:MFS family permease
MNKERLLPLTGVGFVVLLIIGFAIAGEPPDADSDVQEIVDHYVDKKDAIWVSTGFFMAAALSLLFFASYLRRLFSEAEGRSSLLPGLILVGASMIALGGAIDGTIQLALAETAEDIEPSAVQALQALWDNDFLPIALGILTFLLSAGLAILKTGLLPRWLGWAAIALVVLGFTPIGFVAFVGMGVFIVIASIVLAVRAGRATAPPPTAP